MNQRPTKKQRELLSFIDGFIKGNGYGPSYREVQRALDYKSVSTVATHVNGLIARGWLVKHDNSARSLEVSAPMEYGGSTTEREIVQKITDLRATGDDASLEQATTLEKSLVILGYRNTDQRELA